MTVPNKVRLGYILHSYGAVRCCLLSHFILLHGYLCLLYLYPYTVHNIYLDLHSYDGFLLAYFHSSVMYFSSTSGPLSAYISCEIPKVTNFLSYL